MDKPTPKLQYHRIRFPTDNLTLGVLRKVMPHAFESEKPEFFMDERSTRREEMGWILWTERALAHKAFAMTLDLPDPHPDEEWSRSELVRMLNDNYEYFRISTGMEATKQMVREIESQAFAQAREYVALGWAR